MMMNTCKIHRSGRLLALPAQILVTKPNLVNGCIDRAGYQEARYLVAPLDEEDEVHLSLSECQLLLLQ